MKRRQNHLFGLSGLLNYGVPYPCPRFGGSSPNLAEMNLARSFGTSPFDLGDFCAATSA